MELVVTINGVKAPKNQCRFIDNKYYLIGNINEEESGDVFEINGRFIRLETGRLIYNITKKCYELKSSSSAIEGLVYYNFDTKEFFKGYFEFNELYDKILIDEKEHTNYVLGSCKLPYSYRERIQDGKYYHISLIKAVNFFKKQKVSKALKESYPYSLENSGVLFKQFKHNYKPVYNKNVSSIDSILKGLSFGLEFETINGIIPNNKLKYLPLVPLRDGSINGLEYVTLPLQSSFGIQALLDSVHELNKRTSYDSTCSLHLHLGNIPRTPEFILALFKLYNLVSDEIYSMFPLYKEKNYGVKRKNYTKPYDKIQLFGMMDNIINTKDKVNSNFSILFNHLVESKKSKVTFESYGYNLEKVINHPLDPDNRAKWNINNRYHVLNFVPLIFTNKQTVEFRIHTPTFEVNKIINFLIISSVLVNTAITYQKEILEDFNKFINRFRNPTLEHLIHYYFSENVSCKNKGNILDELMSYIRVRQECHYELTRHGKLSYDEKEVYFKGYVDYTNKPNSLYIPPSILKKEEFKYNELLKAKYSYGYDNEENQFRVEMDNILRRDLNNPAVNNNLDFLIHNDNNIVIEENVRGLNWTEIDPNNNEEIR